MDFGAKIQEIVEKIKREPDLMQNFLKQPVETVEKILGVDLPEEEVSKVTSAVMKKLGGAGGSVEDGFKELLAGVKPSGDEVREEYEGLGLQGTEKIDDILGKLK